MKTYISIIITYYSSQKSDVYYHRHRSGEADTFTHNKLTPIEANRLMWELVKLGGKNHYRSNIFDNAISSREVYYYGNT